MQTEGHSNQKLWYQAPDVIVRTIEEETILLKREAGAASLRHVYSLNATGTWVWERIHDGRSIEQLCASAQGEFETENDLARLIQDLLVDLETEGLAAQKAADGG